MIFPVSRHRYITPKRQRLSYPQFFRYFFDESNPRRLGPRLNLKARAVVWKKLDGSLALTSCEAI